MEWWLTCTLTFSLLTCMVYLSFLSIMPPFWGSLSLEKINPYIKGCRLQVYTDKIQGMRKWPFFHRGWEPRSQITGYFTLFRRGGDFGDALRWEPDFDFISIWIRWFREAFIKKKKKIREIFHRWGGGWSKIKNFTVFKVMFKIHIKAILSHFGKKKCWVKKRGGPNT